MIGSRTGSRGSRIRRRRLLAITVLASLVAASCGGDDDDADEPEESTEISGAEPAESDDSVSDEPAEDEQSEQPAEETGEETGEESSENAPIVVTIAPEEEETDPVPGGTLRYGLEADVNGINPTASALSAPGLMMGNAVFDTLAAITPDGGAVPYLAESFTPSEDYKSWTMKLRPDVTFHDGEPLNADAVLVNFEAQRNHPLVGLAVKPFFPETDAVVKVDELTVQFNLLDANAYFPATVAGQLGMVASPKWLEAALADPTLNQKPVGTGPFVFDSRSEDSVTRFVRNDSWWNGEVYLDAVEFYPVPDPATRADLLFGGELEALQTSDPETVLSLDTEGINNVLDETGEESFAMINTTSPPFDDLRARQALANATPISDYIDLIGLGAVRRANGRFIAESPFHNPDIVQAGDDPDTALALVAEYCAEHGDDVNTITGGPACSDGKINIELQWSGPSVIQTRVAELLESSWSVAFNVTFDELLQDEHIQQTAFGQYNVNTWRQFGAEDPSTDNLWLLCRTIGGISLNWPRYCDEERDAILMQAQASTDPAERASLYQQAEQMINDAYTYIFFHHTLWDNAFADNVHGVCERTSPEGELLKCASNGRTWFSSVWIEP